MSGRASWSSTIASPAASILHQAGVNVSVNTDGVSGTTAINIDAAKTMRYGGLSEQEALDLITINPARELGIDHRTGSIEVGKDADLVVWDGHPLSVYSHVDTTIIDGEVYFQRHDLGRSTAISRHSRPSSMRSSTSQARLFHLEPRPM